MPVLRFATPTRLPLEAAFDGGRLTSDGGLPWLAEADAALGLCTALAAGIPEWRRGPVRHSLETLLRQRVFQIACGYADQNDAEFFGNLKSADRATLERIMQEIVRQRGLRAVPTD